MMQRAMLSLVIAASVCLLPWGTAARAADEKPDATFQLDAASIGAGIGTSWGAGVLTYKGQSYPFKINGLAVGTVGAVKATTSGEVYNMKKLEDFNGNYLAVGAGIAIAGGGSMATMKNQNGVKIDVKSTTQGAKVTLGEGGVKIELIK
jgi:hypothetical protein